MMRNYKADLEKVKELKKQVRDLALDYEEEMDCNSSFDDRGNCCMRFYVKKSQLYICA